MVASSPGGRVSVVPSLPEETARAARAALCPGDPYLALGDSLDGLLSDFPVTRLDPEGAFRIDTLVVLALVTVFQFAEDLGDWPASAALTQRIDWKYALRLPMEHQRLDPSPLCYFRRQVIGDALALQVFQRFLERLGPTPLLARARPGLRASAVLEALCEINQLEQFQEIVCQALEALTCHHPEALRSLIQPHWYHRYEKCQRRAPEQESAARRRALAQVGDDARQLLLMIANSEGPDVKALPEIRHLSAVWERACRPQADSGGCKDSCRTCPCSAQPDPGANAQINSAFDTSEEES